MINCKIVRKIGYEKLYIIETVTRNHHRQLEEIILLERERTTGITNIVIGQLGKKIKSKNKQTIKESLSMKYHFRIYKESDGFWAECIELTGCNTQADSMDELIFNMQEVLGLYLSEFTASKNPPLFPSSNNVNNKNMVKVEVRTLCSSKKNKKFLIDSAFEEFYSRYGSICFKNEHEWVELKYSSEQFYILQILMDFKNIIDCELN